jgi:glutathione S-transferase
MSNGTLFYHPVSTTSLGPLVVARALGLDVEAKVLDITKGEQMTPEFLALNPQHQVPTFKETDGTSVWESNAIIRYLCNKYADKSASLYPTDAATRGRVEMALDWRQSSFYPSISKAAYPTLGFSAEDTKAKGVAELPGRFKTLTEFFLAGDRKFIAGDQVTVADIVIALPVCFLGCVPEVVVPEAVVAYVARVREAVKPFGPAENGDGAFGPVQYVAMKTPKA